MNEQRDPLHEADPLQQAMAALAAGDRSAFDPVFRALWPRCSRFARKLLAGDDALADDAAQQALLQLFHEAPRFDPKRSAIGWALTLTGFQVRTAKRKRERRRESAPASVVEALACGGADPEHDTVRKDLVAAALSLVDGLNDTDKEAVQRALDDAGGGDAASRKRRQRAFERLRAAWRERYG